MKPVQDLSNKELLAEMFQYKPTLIPDSRAKELGKELARRLKEKTIKLDD